jgi:hypothetical protein
MVFTMKKHVVLEISMPFSTHLYPLFIGYIPVRKISTH